MSFTRGVCWWGIGDSFAVQSLPRTDLCTLNLRKADTHSRAVFIQYVIDATFTFFIGIAFQKNQSLYAEIRFEYSS